MNAATKITLSYRATSVPDFETTWGEFAQFNRDDADMLADIERQIAEHNYACVGGGARPEIWVFA